MSIDKEFISVYVEKETANKIREAESDEAKALIVLDIIDKKKIDFRDDLEMLDESKLAFKAICLTHKNELEKIYNEQSEKLYKLWEDMGDVHSSIRQHTKLLVGEIAPVSREIEKTSGSIADLKKELESLRVYGSQELVKLAEQISRMDSNTKDILRSVLNAGKK